MACASAFWVVVGSSGYQNLNTNSTEISLFLYQFHYQSNLKTFCHWKSLIKSLQKSLVTWISMLGSIFTTLAFRSNLVCSFMLLYSIDSGPTFLVNFFTAWRRFMNWRLLCSSIMPYCSCHNPAWPWSHVKCDSISLYLFSSSLSLISAVSAVVNVLSLLFWLLIWGHTAGESVPSVFSFWKLHESCYQIQVLLLFIFFLIQNEFKNILIYKRFVSVIKTKRIMSTLATT